jgi:hypothetical protein
MSITNAKHIATNVSGSKATKMKGLLVTNTRILWASYSIELYVLLKDFVNGIFEYKFDTSI